jgi:hypothetical protein
LWYTPWTNGVIIPKFFVINIHMLGLGACLGIY